MKLTERFSQTKILVVGDVMLDRYWWGDVTRISPEAPVPVVRLKKDSFAPGGAANVGVNIAGLGSNVFLVGSVGDDAEAESLKNCLSDRGVIPDFLVTCVDRPTNVKTRIIAHNQQVVRVDQEFTSSLSKADEAGICSVIFDTIKKADVVVISDYAKGVLTPGVLSHLFELANQNGKPVIVDPKGKDYSKYRGATVLTPNRREAAEACNLEMDGEELVDLVGRRLMDELALKALLITQSEDGMTLFQQNHTTAHLEAVAREVYDVTGAGDTVIASMAVAFGAGLTFYEAAKIANVAASVVVQQVGTSSITIDKLNDALDSASSALA